MTSSDARPYGHDIYVNPNGTFALSITFVGISVIQSSNWTAKVMRNEYDPIASAVYTPTIAVNTTANTVTVTFAAASLLGLMSTGSARWSGFWQLENTVSDVVLIGGSMKIDRNRAAASSSSALTLTVTSTTITATVTTSAPVSFWNRNFVKSLEEIIEGTITRDANGGVTSAQIVFPDGTPGLMTTTELSTLHPGAIISYYVDYLGATTIRYTQPAMTRDTNGAITYRPAITVA